MEESTEAPRQVDGPLPEMVVNSQSPERQAGFPGPLEPRAVHLSTCVGLRLRDTLPEDGENPTTPQVVYSSKQELLDKVPAGITGLAVLLPARADPTCDRCLQVP